MKLLGIETATAVCSAALVENGNKVTERSIVSKQMHSEKLLFLIDECLMAAETRLQLIDGIAVSIGPGSFTGLRIGLSVAKGLVYATGLPIVGIQSLQALAWNVTMHEKYRNECVIMPLIDARRDEVYCAVYRWNGTDMTELHPPQAAYINALPAMRDLNLPIVVTGDGTEKFKEFIKKTAFNKSSSYIFQTGPLLNCSAVPVAAIGLKRISAGISDHASSLEPLYVKEFYTPVKTEK